MIPDPYQSPQKWDTVVVSGQPWVFLCRVHEFKRRFDWDEKKGKGAQGASLTYTGFHLARGHIDFYMLSGIDPTTGQPWLHLPQWANFSELFKYDPTKTKATAVTIYHPSLAIMKPPLTAVICEDITNPTLVAPDTIGWYKSTVSLIEYAPPPKASAVSTPTAAIAKAKPPNAPPGVVQDPADVALQKQIAQQLAIAQAPL